MPTLTEISANLLAISGGDVGAFSRATQSFERSITTEERIPADPDHTHRPESPPTDEGREAGTNAR